VLRFEFFLGTTLKLIFYVIKGGTLRFSRDSNAAFCMNGYEDRLCQRCSSGYYSSGSQCKCCSSTNIIWPYILAGCAFAMALFVFVVVKSTGTMFLWGEIIVFVIMLLVVGSHSWLLTILCVIMILQLSLQLQNQMRKKKHAAIIEKPPILSLGSFLKLFIFFVQTNLSVNARLWDAFDFMFESLAFLNLDISGIACNDTLSSVFETEWSRFLVTMAVPPTLLVCICFCLLLRLAVQKMILSCKRCRQKEHEKLHVEQEEQVKEDDVLIKNDDALDSNAVKNFDQESNGHENFGASVVTIGLFLAFVCYFELVEEIFSGKSCLDRYFTFLITSPVFRVSLSQNGTAYLEAHPWIEFSLANEDFRYLLISSVVFLVVYVIGIPVLFCFLIFSRNRGHVGEFLWENYKPEYFYFEVIWLLRRLSIAVVVAAVPEMSEFKPILIIGLLGLYGVVQFRMRPFRNEFENLFDWLATVLIMLTFAENFWAQQLVTLIGSDIPAGFYVVFALNCLFVISLITAVMWPLITSLLVWVKRKCTKHSIHEMRGFSESLSDFEVLQTEENQLRSSIRGSLNLDDLDVKTLRKLHSALSK
jgi:hypothetical protein